MKNINKFIGTNAFLSNFYLVPVEYQGLIYPSSENLYQALKAKDKNRRLEFINITPGESKKLGREISIRKNWDSVKKAKMMKVCELKFKQNKSLRERLLATGTHFLIEGNTWHDNTWGDCTCNKCINIYGKNMLGIILMLIRQKLGGKNFFYEKDLNSSKYIIYDTTSFVGTSLNDYDYKAMCACNSEIDATLITKKLNK